MKKYYAIISVTALALFMRLYDLTRISLWHDEAFSALLIRYPWGQMFHRIAEDVHPPLYYIVLRFWTYVFGSSVLSLRGFSAVCGAIAVPLAYYLVDKYFENRKAAIWTALFMSVNFFEIYRGSLEARMYTFGIMLSLLATISLLAALYNREPGRKTWILYLVFSLLGASLIYTHYYLSFNLIALGAYGLYYHFKNYRWDFKKYLPFIASCLFVGVLFVPWLKVFKFQLTQVQDVFWIWPMDRWSISNTLWDLAFALRSGRIPNDLLLILVTLAVIAMFYGCIRHIHAREKWLVLGTIVAPFLGSLAFLVINHIQGHTSSVFLDRYFVLISPFFFMAVALWLSSWNRQSWAKVIVIFIVVVNIASFYDFWYDQGASSKPGMAALTTYLNDYAAGPKDKILVATPYEYFNLKYYIKTQNAPLLLSYGRAHVSQMDHYDGTALLEDSNLAPDIKTAASAEDTAWVVWTNAYSNTKPPVPENWTQIDERGYDDIQPYATTIYITEYRVN